MRRNNKKQTVDRESGIAAGHDHAVRWWIASRFTNIDRFYNTLALPSFVLVKGSPSGAVLSPQRPSMERLDTVKSVVDWAWTLCWYCRANDYLFNFNLTWLLEWLIGFNDPLLQDLVSIENWNFVIFSFRMEINKWNYSWILVNVFVTLYIQVKIKSMWNSRKCIFARN